MKKTLFLLSAFIFCVVSNAQQFSYDWHHNIPSEPGYGSPFYEHSCIYGDTLFLLGEMSGADSADLDPGITTDWLYDENLSSVSKMIFVSKYLISDGSYQGSMKLIEFPTATSGGIYGSDLAIDQTGRIIIVGYSATGADFDPSLSSAGWYGSTGGGSFAAFYYSNGSYMSHLEYDYVSSVSDLYLVQCVIDDANNLYLVGNYYGTVDFDFTAGTDNHTSVGDYDACVIKVNLTTQAYTWGVSFGSVSTENCQYAVLSNGRLNLYGTFDSGTIDLDPGIGNDDHVQPAPHQCTFVNQLDLNGNQTAGFVLAAHYMYGITADPQGNVYLLAETADGEIVDMDPGSGIHLLNTVNQYPMAVAKYDIDLNYLWARSFTASAGGHDIRTIAATNSYVSVSGYNYDELYVSSETDSDTIPMPIDGEYFIANLNSGSGDLFEYNSFPFIPSTNSYAEGSTQIVTENDELISVGIFKYKLDLHCYDSVTAYDSTMFNGFDYGYNPFILKLNFLGFATVEEHDFNSDFNIYPNPTSSNFTIQSDKVISQIQIFDITGKIVLSESIIDKNMVQIDASNFESGVYFIQVIDANKEFTSYKLIKN